MEGLVVGAVLASVLTVFTLFLCTCCQRNKPPGRDVERQANSSAYPRPVDHSQIARDQQINSSPYLIPLHDYTCERYLRDPVDLHGLSVVQAREEVRQALNTHAYPVFIVGKGLHSADKQPRVKPAVEVLLNDLGYGYAVPVNNSGRLMITRRPNEKSFGNM